MPAQRCEVGCQCGLHRSFTAERKAKIKGGSPKCTTDCQCGRHQNGRQPRSEAHKRSISKALMGIKRSENTRQKLREVLKVHHPKGMLGKHHSEQTKLKMAESTQLQMGFLASRQRSSEIGKRNWTNPELAQRMTRGSGGINKAEILLLELIEPLGFWYTGGGPERLVIERMVPDFWDGNQMIVELYGDYWHRGQNPQDRIDRYVGVGYRCMVLWEYELRFPDLIIEKMHAFMRLN